MRRMVFDLGMHEGQDTAFYLQRGFDVVGVEANPALLPGLHRRFAAELDAGRLHIIGKAISATPGPTRLFVSSHSVLTTLSTAYAERNTRGGYVGEAVEVDSIACDEIFASFGVPYFLKIDLEGVEDHCLDALGRQPERPAFLSVEARAASPGCGMRDTLRELRTVHRLGYRRFAYVSQALVPGRTDQLDGEGPPIAYTFETHASGPFGRDLRVRWLNVAAAAAYGGALCLIDDACGHSGRFYGRKGMWRLRRLRGRLTGHADHWYDLHAALS